MQWKRCLIWVSAALVLIAPVACFRSAYFERAETGDDFVMETGRPVSVTRVAAEIDALEKHIEWYGSIVPKRPDVWGQARLMAHRFEFEDEMKKDLTTFKPTIAASISRSDSAFLATAVSLGIAANAPNATAGGQGGKAEVKNGDVTATISNSSNTTINPLPENSKLRVGTVDAPIEPTITLNQQARYLNHLHELRRINEGDDNADTPGYALNLVRIPVSILTGSHTDKGYGAELSVTASIPYDDELLPTTFRNLVIGDLVDLGSLPIAQFIGAENIDKLIEQIERIDFDPVRPVLKKMPAASGSPAIESPEEMLVAPTQTRNAQMMRNKFEDLAKRMSVASKLAAQFNVPARQRVSQLPLASSQVIEVFGEENVLRIIAGISRSIRSHLPNDGSNREEGRVPYHLDIQGALADELLAAYKFIDEEKTLSLWKYCTPDLAAAVRRRNAEKIRDEREKFDEEVDRLIPKWKETIDREGKQIEVWRSASDSITACLAWAIIVQSALLEERLNSDIKAVESAKGVKILPDNTHFHFHGQHAPPEARKAFYEYVKARWPIYVFALDPVTDEQNVGDRYTEVRDAQLAVAVAFAAGQINGAAAMNYMRKLTRDIETIGLNRTIVGFAHGENHFGWRFYPRVQTPPFQGTVATVASLISPPDDKKQMNREARLENGQRECVAIMIMPSFVPNVDFEFTSNWFHLNSTKVRKGTLKNAMRLSQRVQLLRSLAPQCPDAAKFRAEDLGLMMNRLEQLSARLPLSRHRVNVPYENTSGGFEMFNSGVTDLGPELHGWYGAPGINPNGVTTLFLVGDNFSVHQTRVVVGGVAINAKKAIDIDAEVKDGKIELKTAAMMPAVELLSRQVMRVTIPSGAMIYSNGTNNLRVIDVHIATPYGVSRHLSIPMLGDIAQVHWTKSEPKPK